MKPQEEHKLFPVSNDEALVSNIHFDNQFSEMRERQKSKWKIQEELKRALEKSIVTVKSGFGVSNTEK